MDFFFSSENTLFVGALLLTCGILVQKPGYRFGVPALLLFLLVGMLFGIDGLGVRFDNVQTAQFIGMVSLSIILFSGGLETRISDIRPVLGPGIMLSTIGVCVTTFFTGVFVWWLSDFSWSGIHFALLPSLLLAATMSSTDSASVFALLRSQKMHLKFNLRPMLELESGSNDPMAYLLTIIIIEILSIGNDISWLSVAWMLIVQFVVGAAMGYAIGRLVGSLMKKLNLDCISFYPILLLAQVFLIFSLTDFMGGNGYLAVYVAGIVIGNGKMVHRRETMTFIDGLTWLCQIVMFLMLGLLVNPHDLLGVAPVALMIGAFMIIVARPGAVFLSLIPFRKINFRSKLFVSWVGLRGAVPILFATYPMVAGVDGNSQLFNIVFFITILSLILQGTTIGRAARWLRLSRPLKNEVDYFGVEIPDEIGTSLREVVVTSSMLESGSTLKEMNLPSGQLVMMVNRGGAFLVPNGTLPLQTGDKLLIIEEEKK